MVFPMGNRSVGKRVHQSYIRAGGIELITSFYNHLMFSSKEIREHFKYVDLEVQSKNLARAIVMSFLNYDNKRHTTSSRVLNNVRESHNRHKLAIKPELYDTWLKCLLDVVDALDPDADESLLEDWRLVMTSSIEHIRSGY